MKVEMSANCSAEQHEGGWVAFVVVYADPDEAQDDQTIDGSRWEGMRDGLAYAVLSISGVGEPTDEAVEAEVDSLEFRLSQDGYDVVLT